MRKFLALISSVLVILAVMTAALLIPGATTTPPDVLELESGEGMTFDGLSLYHTAKDNPVTEVPVTYEAWVLLPAGYSEDAGTIYGNYRSADLGGVRFRIRVDGRPHIYYTGDGDSALSVNFYDVNVANGLWTHLTIVDDVSAGEMRCYLNGDLIETVEMTSAQIAYKRDVSGMPMCVGGDFIAGTNNFKGNIRSVAVYSDVRTGEEIRADMESIDLTDDNLISAYNLNNMQGQAVLADATGKYDVINNRMTSDWARPEEVADLEDYAYSMALIGDTQIVAGYYPEEFHHIMDWLLENKEDHKIAHVLNMGDMTNFNYDEEWDLVRDQYFRLNGKIDYTLVRGDHDVLDDEVANNGDDTTKYDRWFDVPAYTDRFNNSEDADYYKGDNGSITNSYRAVDINGNKYLIVTMDKYPSEDVLAWLDTAIKKYPDRRVIMTMHCYITDNGEYIQGKNDPDKLIGTDIWNRIKGYENLEMVICGHEYAYGVVWTKAEGTNGNVVNQILANPQGPDFDREGATGMIAMLYFSEDGTDVQVRYYSPIIDRYFVGNNNEVYDENYRLESSVFSMKTDDMSLAEQITETKTVEYVSSNTNVYAESNGAEVQVSYNTDVTPNFEYGKIIMRYDSSLLADPQYSWNITATNTNVEKFDGVLIFSWDGASVTNESGDLFNVSFTSSVNDASPAVIDIDVRELGYTENNTVYVMENVNETGTVIKTSDEIVVTYNSNNGDDFKERLEYALSFAKYSPVTFKMETGFTATKSITVGDVENVSQHTVTIVSSNTASPVEINTGGFNIIFAGNYNFDYIKITGNGTGVSNSLFFPNGSSAVFGNNITAGSKTANVTGADIVINSGNYYFVGALIDETVGMSVVDAHITLQGTAVADCLSGGSRLTGNVAGCSMVTLGGAASVTRYASASGYAAYSKHDGQLDVNTTGTVGRLCAAVGPVGTATLTPTYWLNIDDVKCTTDVGFMGVRSIVNNKPCYANTVIEVRGGTFSKPSCGGLYVASSYKGVTNYGSNYLTISDGDFTAEVYGAGYLDGNNCNQEASSYLTIYDGEFSKYVVGGSFISATGCKQTGSTSLVFEGGNMTASIYGGSRFAEDTTDSSGAEVITSKDSIHIGNSELLINDGNFTGYIYGGSYMYGKYTEHYGDTLTEFKGGTFGADTQVFGGSTLQTTNTLHSGKATLNIYGGVTLKKYVTGGCQLWANGTGYGIDGGNGVHMSGDVEFNIYNIDKDGNPAVATISGGRLFASSYVNSSYAYAEQSGNTTYSFAGITLPTTSCGGMRAQGKYNRMSGDITGTLSDMTISGTFIGGSELYGANAVESGDITLNLRNTVVYGTVSAGPSVSKATHHVTGKSKLTFESGTITGSVIGGCYFVVPNVVIEGSSELVFGLYNTVPVLSAGGKLIGGSYAATKAFTTAGTTGAWGMYGSSDLTITSGRVEEGGYLIGGSYVSTTSTPTNTVDWDNYPVVGGIPGENNTNHTKLTINGGMVNGPKIYAGSYLADGGQDHGHVILEVNGGTVKVTSECIENYTSTNGYEDISYKCIYPATFYPVNTKEITCDYTLTLNGGYFDTVADKTIGFAVFHGYNGVINGDTELNIAITTQNGKANTKYRINRVVGGINEPMANAVLKGNSTLNIYKTDNSTPYMYPGNPMTAGCYSTSTLVGDKEDKDANDGIKYGFTQIGDVTLNMSAGTIYRTTTVSGYRSNVDGNVYINISGGKIGKDVHGVGDNSVSSYSSVTGDVVWNISDVTLDTDINLYGGGDAKSSVTYAEGYNVIGGNLYMEISGGTFNGNLLLAGNNSINAGKEARIKFVGNKFVLGTKVLPHGTVCGEYVGTYTVDLFHAEKAVDTSAFENANIIAPFADGCTVSLADVAVGPGDAISAVVEGQNVVIDGKEYSYDYLTAFDNYTTKYKNAFAFEDADEEGNVLGAIEEVTPYPTHKVIVKVGSKASSPTLLNHVFKIANKSVSLASSLIMNYMIPKSLETEYGYTITKAEVTFAGQTDTIYYEKDEYGDAVLNKDRYVFKFRDIAPQGVADDMTIVVYATYNDGEKDVEIKAQALKFGVIDYCYGALNNSAFSSYTNMQRAIVDLLNYASEAQIYTNYNTENLANAGLTDEQKALASADTVLEGVEDMKNVNFTTIDNPTATIVPSVTVHSSIIVRYRVVLPEGVTPAEATLKIVNASDANREWNLTGTDFVSTGKANEYYAYLSALNAEQVTDLLYATVYVGETAISNTCRYTIGSYYVAAQAQTDSSFDTLKALTKAMMKYGIAVGTYAANPTV